MKLKGKSHICHLHVPHLGDRNKIGDDFSQLDQLYLNFEKREPTVPVLSISNDVDEIIKETNLSMVKKGRGKGIKANVLDLELPFLGIPNYDHTSCHLNSALIFFFSIGPFKSFLLDNEFKNTYLNRYEESPSCIVATQGG
jgi:hypothetical protein